MAQTCRFYEQRFPEIDDVVMVNVISIAEMGAYVRLLEYNGIEGMILLSELSRRRIRSINKLVRVGRRECVVVLRVDKEKGYIDLSKRRVSAEEIAACEEKFNKAKAVNSILRHVADQVSMDVEDLYTKTAWPLDKKHKSSYDAFKMAIYEPEVLDELALEPSVHEALLANIKLRLTPQPTKIRADLEVSCFAYEGVDAVKKALLKGLAHSSEEMPVRISLIAPPLYSMSAQSLDKDRGIEILNAAIESIRECITASGGTIVVQNPPRAISDSEDKELADMLTDLEKQNTEVGGDDDRSDSEED